LKIAQADLSEVRKCLKSADESLRKHGIYFSPDAAIDNAISILEKTSRKLRQSFRSFGDEEDA